MSLMNFLEDRDVCILYLLLSLSLIVALTTEIYYRTDRRQKESQTQTETDTLLQFRIGSSKARLSLNAVKLDPITSLRCRKQNISLGVKTVFTHCFFNVNAIITDLSFSEDRDVDILYLFSNF